jgi:hypothetical protein
MTLTAGRVKNMHHSPDPGFFQPPPPSSALTVIFLTVKRSEEVSVCYGMGCYTICSAVHVFVKCKIPREVKSGC